MNLEYAEISASAGSCHRHESGTSHGVLLCSAGKERPSSRRFLTPTAAAGQAFLQTAVVQAVPAFPPHRVLEAPIAVIDRGPVERALGKQRGTRFNSG